VNMPDATNAATGITWSTHPCNDPERACRLLIVDDEPDLRMLVGVVFDDLGWRVDEAADGCEALTKLQTEMYDLVLLDHRMPGMSGAEVYAQVRAAGNAVPVVLVTAARQVEEIAARHGFSMFLGKPFGIDDLIQIVDKMAPHC